MCAVCQDRWLYVSVYVDAIWLLLCFLGATGPSPDSLYQRVCVYVCVCVNVCVLYVQLDASFDVLIGPLLSQTFCTTVLPAFVVYAKALTTSAERVLFLEGSDPRFSKVAANVCKLKDVDGRYLPGLLNLPFTHLRNYNTHLEVLAKGTPSAHTGMLSLRSLGFLHLQ
jgi:hypothetical protein